MDPIKVDAYDMLNGMTYIGVRASSNVLEQSVMVSTTSLTGGFQFPYELAVNEAYSVKRRSSGHLDINPEHVVGTHKDITIKFKD